MKSFTIWKMDFTTSNFISFLRNTERSWCSRIYLTLMVILIGGISYGQTYKDNLAQVQNINYQAQGVPGLEWVGSVLQSNNSSYSEGMSTLQRVILENLPATTDNIHTLRMRLQTQKDGKHAYDFITSWEQSMKVAQVIQPANLVSLPDPDAPGYPIDYENLKCADAISATAFDVCDGAEYEVFLPINGEINLPLAGDLSTTSQVIASYEAIYGPRTVKVRGEQPFYGPAANNKVVFAGYDGVDMYYDITWQSTSTGIVIEFGAHIAAGFSPSGQYGGVTPADGIVGYGPMQGASNVSGAPYHVSFAGFQTNENKTMGSQDNQLMASGVKLIPYCDLDGPLFYCLGDSGNVFYNGNPTNVDGPEYTWELTNNGTNAAPVGDQSGSSLEVNPGTQAGSYTVKFTVTNDGGFYDVCEITTIIGNPTANAGSDDSVCWNEGINQMTLNGSASGGTSPYGYAWSGTGSTYLSATNVAGPTFDNAPVGTYNLTLTVTDANGCQDTDTVQLVVDPNPTANAGSDDSVCWNEGINQMTLNGSASGGTSPYGYAWSGTGSTYLSATNVAGPTFDNAPVGTYNLTLTVTDANGCSDTDTVDLEILASPIVSIDPVTSVCLGESVQLVGNPSGGIFSGDGVTAGGLFTPTEAKSYSITYSYTDPITGCSDTATINISGIECVTCETAFAKADGVPGIANCFIDDVFDSNPGSNRWGWTNQFTGANGSFTDTMILYAGAGQCDDTSKGVAAGEVHISYNADNGTVTVKYDMQAYGYVMSSAHLYVGCTPYPMKKQGKTTVPTVAPGQYPFSSSSTGYFDKFEPDPIYVGNGTFYIIAHADVCTSANNDHLEYYPQLTSNQEVQYLSASRNKPLSYVCGSVKNGGPAAKGSEETISKQSSDIVEEPVVATADVAIFPVPFKETLNIQYKFDYVSDVVIQFFDMRGQLLRSVQDKNVTQGAITTINIDFAMRASQTYIVKVITDRETIVKQIVSDK
ncbi:MAG TPA: T9SS type A sorting domain-containing protein [Gillisia sp.]|nr:T9SS type A sorting domain-containing protein [Gillisia sp.]